MSVVSNVRCSVIAPHLHIPPYQMPNLKGISDKIGYSPLFFSVFAISESVSRQAEFSSAIAIFLFATGRSMLIFPPQYLCSNDAPTEDTQRPVPSTVGQPESTVGGALLNQPSFRHRAHTPTAHTPTGFTSSLQDMGYTHAGVHAQYSSHKGWAEAGDEGESGNDLADTLQEQTAEGLPPQKPQYERLATRTIMLSNLAEGITHADIIAVVRGGQVLEVFLRNHDHSATLSFVQAADAKNFYDYARRYDVYIKNKRVSQRGLLFGCWTNASTG